jgi:4-hydroxy-3-polyprenylbenzoate decarboxylase
MIPGDLRSNAWHGQETGHSESRERYYDMRSTRECVADLQRGGHLAVIDDEIDPRLEAAEIQRRVYLNRGPAVLFTNVKGCRFPMVSNLFGTIQRAEYLFRDMLDAVRRAIELKIDPNQFFRNPGRYWKTPLTAWRMQPKSVRTGPVLYEEIKLSELPQLVSWPDDGGPFVTLPQVYTEHPDHPGFAQSNLGMYRVQLSGNQYATDREAGLHYQTHRGIGVHHQAARAKKWDLRVNVFVGGTPAMTLAAVMPLPEGISELTFAGALAGHRIPMIRRGDELPIYGDADFCIVGTVDPDVTKPEGPFGDHLGYYSLQHPFPVLRVEHVYARQGAIWPFTVVGRPPQEDTTFGELIHEITGPIIPTVLPGVHGVHAVDAAGVHPLMLAIGSERYMPFLERPQPQELLTQANAILGQGQMSLAKYLLIINKFDAPGLDVHDVRSFLRHLLERIDWSRDLHFQTRTTIDTLDYSGHGLNQGSKVVMAAVGPAIRELRSELPSDLTLPEGFDDPHVCLPGVIAIRGPKFDVRRGREDLTRFCDSSGRALAYDGFPLIVLVDDSDFAARSLNNFLWTTFTRSNPAVDIFGFDAFYDDKHWGCRGPLVIDARIKPHHAPPLIEDPEVTKRVDAFAARGGVLGPYL